jgi:hypothetical protein
VMKVDSWDEALAWCERFTKTLGGSVEMDLRPIA